MLQPKFNRYPKPTDWNSLILLAQQAFEDGFRAPTFTDLVAKVSELVSVLGGTGIVPTVEPNTTLPAPVQAGKIMIMKAGDYLQPDGVTELTAPANSFNVGYWDGEAWSVDISIETEADLTPYAKKAETAAIADFIPALSDDTNLFDKNRNLNVGFVLSSDGSFQANPNTSITDYIYIGEGTRVFIRKTWSGAPTAYAWYDTNKNFISYHSAATSEGMPDAPGGELPTRPTNARFIVLNVTANNGTDLPSNSDGLMVYVGRQLIDYQQYTINPDVSRQMVFVNRAESYASPVSAIPIDSALNRYTPITATTAGRWNVRDTLGASVSRIGNYIRLEIDGITGQPAPNAGLLMPRFFRSTDVAYKIHYRFEARLVSGSGLYAIYSNNGTSRVDVNIDSADFKIYDVEAIVGADQYGDQRLLFGVPTANTASTIEIRHFQAFFVKPWGEQDKNPKVEYNLSALPNLLYKLSATPQLAVLAIQGDSWTDHVPGSIFYARDLARLLRDEYGDGGGGWYDFANSNSTGQKMASIDPDDANDSRSGTITYRDNTDYSALGINFADATFAAGATLTLNVLKPHTQFMISYYGGTAYGTFRYRIDMGEWNNIDTSSSVGHQTIIENTTDSTHVIEFEALTGSVILFGVDMRRSSGIRVHKLGNRGLRAFDIPNFDAENWKSQLAALEPDAITTLLGTNDRTASRTPASFKADMAYFVDMCRSAVPYVDVCLISPSNNRNSEAYEMQDYTAELRSIAEVNSVPFINLIPLFGSTNQILAKGTFSDAVHPTEDGGKMIADFLFRCLF